MSTCILHITSIYKKKINRHKYTIGKSPKKGKIPKKMYNWGQPPFARYLAGGQPVSERKLKRGGGYLLSHLPSSAEAELK